MVSTELVRNHDELKELHEWLLGRAQEEERNGKENYGRIYREYADLVYQEINC